MKKIFLMRIFLTVTISFLSILIYSQNKKTIDAIDKNNIRIENADPDTELVIFNKNIPQQFTNAKIFGFGEATHHGKEFFNLKAKFFKYLVLNQNVKTFIMEESYPSEIGINRWISGGEGNIETISKSFSIVPWKCKEVVNLFKWIRNYNSDKVKEEQIRFYGMDIQNVKNINKEIRDFINKYNIPISEELLLATDACVKKTVDYGKPTNWSDIQLPKLKMIEKILFDFQKSSNNENNTEFNLIIRALNYLKKYTFYIQNHYSQDRDLKMYENVKWIIENESKNRKAFIWAHNEHINNKGFGNYSKRNIYNLGRHLKEHYGDQYFSVGFDFGKGNLIGFTFNKKEGGKWKTHKLDKPFSKTYAKTLIEAKDDIYFINIAKTKNNILNNFFKKKSKQLVLGASGYNPKRNNLYNKKLSEMYDGLIFIKNISLPDYKVTNL